MTFNIEKSICNMSGIYSITTSIDNRFYIGSTVNFWRRYRDHKTKLINGNHANAYMQSFANKYGLDKYSFNLLYLCKNSCLVFNEKLWIEFLKPQFNIKKIITRPYFDDEVEYAITNVVSPINNIVITLDNLSGGDGFVKRKYSRNRKAIKLSKFTRQRRKQLDEIIRKIKEEDSL